MTPSKLVALFIALVAGAASAERLPVRAWSAADGLGHEHARCVLRDAQGFLWFCTAAGLARFDGARFQRFGVAEGLPAARVHAAAQTPDGTIWAATERGLARLVARAGASPGARFEPVSRAASDFGEIRALLVERDGSLLAGGTDGLERIRANGGSASEPESRCADPELERIDVRALARTPDGTLWIGGGNGRLVGVPGDGGPCFALALGSPGLWLRALLADREGRLWIGSDDGLARIDRPELASAETPLRHFGAGDGLVSRRIRALFETPEGTLWVGAVGALHRWDGERFYPFTMANGLPDDTFNGFAIDREGELWLASDSGGVARLLSTGFLSYGRGDGLGHVSVGHLFTDRDGRLVVSGEVAGWISRFEDERFSAVVPRLPTAMAARVATSKTWALEDHAGEWWLATVDGLVRYSKPSRLGDLAATLPLEILGRASGLPSDWTYRLFEQADGALWVATASGDRGETLARLSTDRREISTYGPANGLPAHGGPECLAESDGGIVWVGWSDGSMLRFERGTFSTVAAIPGFPIRDLHPANETLWIATGGAGVRSFALTAAPGGETLQLGPPEVAGDDVRSIAHDGAGSLYFATASGVVVWRRGDRPRRFDTASGLAALETNSVEIGPAGELWVGTFGGVSRLRRLEPAPHAPPARLWIRSLEVDGAELPISPLGQASLGPFALDSGRHRLRVAWFGPSFVPGEPLRVRYRVLGLDPAWSEPGEELALTLGGFAPGRYRLEVRSATAADDTPSAVVSWTVAAPLWSRAWFLALVGAVLAGAGVLVHRLRVARLLELERVRTRIAGDLHDDLSASLTRISVRSEVAARSADGADTASASVLREIGADARALLDSTRDLVWAIDPREDSLAGLVARLRPFLDGLADPEGIAVSLSTEGNLADARLSVEERRHLLLLLKEAVHNAVRHAAARAISVRIAANPSAVVLEVRDDGRGFDPEREETRAVGRGLRGMRARAGAIRAELSIASAPGEGTVVRILVARD